MDHVQPWRHTLRSVHVVNLGCRENLAIGSLATHYFVENDWEVVEAPESADVILLNSCGFCESAERMSMREYDRLMAAKRADARLIFAGCLPAINKALVRSAGYQGVFVTPRTLGRLDEMIDAAVPIESLDVGCLPFTPSDTGLKGILLNAVRGTASALSRIPYAPMPRWFWQMLSLPWHDTEYVKVGVGCLGECSYCAIRRAKGSTKSVPIDAVMKRVEEAVGRGVTSIAFSCDELGSYGQDIGTDIATLLESVVSLPGEFRLILRNLEPEWIRDYWDRLEPVFQTGRIAYVITPLQSGSDRVLALMRRHYTAAEYRRVIEGIRAASPKTIIRTHLMTGFPGETREDFRETYRLVGSLPLDHFSVFEYSERPYIPSAKLPDQVPQAVIEHRRRHMLLLNAVCYLKPGRWLPLRPQAA